MEVNKDTMEVIKELQEEGFDVSGFEKEPEEPKKPEKVDENEANKNEDTKPDDSDDENSKKNPDKVKPIERQPREPKKVKLPDGSETEAWRIKVQEKHEARDEAKKNDEIKKMVADVVREQLGTLKLNTATPEKVEDEFQKIAEKYELNDKGADFLREIQNVILSKLPANKIPDDVQEKLSSLDELRNVHQREREDMEFERNFSKEILPKLKELNKDVDNDAVEKSKELFKGFYFSERYHQLSPLEIFSIKKDELSDVVGKSVRPPEGGSKSGSSRGHVVDYDNITEEEYEKLSDEEQEKIDQYLIRKQRGLA